jgi:two-component system, cell cycle sensor histidine kinase and response regulator CckA
MLPVPAKPNVQPPTPRRVLVVEDEEMVGEVVRAMLLLGGYAADHAKGPIEALELLARPEPHYDLLLTDFRMPKMSGIELIQQAKPLRPHIKTILYSGNADASVAYGFSVQPDHFLPKPFTPAVLNGLVRSVLGA